MRKTVISISFYTVTIKYLAILLILSFVSFGQDNKSQFRGLESKLELPEFRDNEIIVEYKGFTLSYDTAHKQARWVAYNHTLEKTKAKVKRYDKFQIDPNLMYPQATNSDYLKSGYDRGHLAPAADMAYSDITMIESFYFTNMSPQIPGFNRGIWKRLEELMRLWAIEYKSILIVTGPILPALSQCHLSQLVSCQDSLPTIGKNRVSVPNKYYKAIVDTNKNRLEGIAFLMNNEPATGELFDYAISIDNLQKISGINFFDKFYSIRRI